MVDILISGGSAETAARAMSEVVREIFEVEPIRPKNGSPSTRGAWELATIILTIPPAVISVLQLDGHLRLLERLKRFIIRAKNEHTSTGARLFIDVGDGKPIPLENASPERILEALARLRDQLKSSDGAH